MRVDITTRPMTLRFDLARASSLAIFESMWRQYEIHPISEHVSACLAPLILHKSPMYCFYTEKSNN